MSSIIIVLLVFAAAAAISWGGGGPAVAAAALLMAPILAYRTRSAANPPPDSHPSDWGSHRASWHLPFFYESTTERVQDDCHAHIHRFREWCGATGNDGYLTIDTLDGFVTYYCQQFFIDSGRAMTLPTFYTLIEALHYLYQGQCLDIALRKEGFRQAADDEGMFSTQRPLVWKGDIGYMRSRSWYARTRTPLQDATVWHNWQIG